jgi:hypothetical protein
MRDGSFREHTETKGSGIDRVVRNQIKLLWSVQRRRSPGEPAENHPDDHELPAVVGPSVDDETRTPFARQLGDSWIEVEPGIYEWAGSPSGAGGSSGEPSARGAPAQEPLDLP